MGRRLFHFSEGTSNKFWSIETTGARTLVHFGKTGTAGQAQEKEWLSEAAALAAAGKLIAEKTKKGYTEQTGSTDSAGAAFPSSVAPVAAPAQRPAKTIKSSQTGNHRVACESPIISTIKPNWHPNKGIQPFNPRIGGKPKAPTAPFHFDSALKAFKKLAVGGRSNWDWDQLSLQLFPSIEEAEFWLRAFGKQGTAESFCESLAARPVTGVIDREMVARALSLAKPPLDQFVCSALFALPLEEAMGYLADDSMSTGYRWVSLPAVFAETVLPYLSVDEIDICRRITLSFIEGIPANLWSIKGEFSPKVLGLRSVELAALLGCQEILAAKLKGCSNCPSQWLDFTGWHHLEAFDDWFDSDDSFGRRRDLMKVLKSVTGPAPVRTMLLAMNCRETRVSALGWLAAHPVSAVVGLVPLAMSSGNLSSAALEHLLSMRQGQRDKLNAALAHLTQEEAAFLQLNVLDLEERSIPDSDPVSGPSDLCAALAAGSVADPPVWLLITRLPFIQIGQSKLSDEHLLCIIRELRKEEHHPMTTSLRRHADQVSLDRFAWALFNEWLASGAPSKDKWALLSLGHLGSDAIALKLVPLIRKWPGEGQHQRAVTGLQVLRTIGTDTALMQLNGIAQKVPFKALKERARELMGEIAKTRGLTKAELEDRIVPDCGLDERGARLFNFGPRQFELLLGSDLKPVIREASGKKRPDLPAPNSTDDPTLAAEAVADWKLLKKNLREVLKIQTERLEQAMITGRRWTAEEFRALFVNHPLMTHLSRWIIWACYDSDGRVSGTFRVSDDRTLTDAFDNAFSLPADAAIGIVHPLQLDETVKNAWGEIHGDYEIIAPFPQLGRSLFALLPDEQSADTIHRGKGRKIAAGSLVGTFEKSGWIRDYPADGGCYAAHSKPFPAASLTAFAQYNPGLWAACSMPEMEDQEITEVYFVPGLRPPAWWSSHKDRIPLANVDPIVLTEVLRDLELLLSKAG